MEVSNLIQNSNPLVVGLCCKPRVEDICRLQTVKRPQSAPDSGLRCSLWQSLERCRVTAWLSKGTPRSARVSTDALRGVHPPGPVPMVLEPCFERALV